jgi:hypothetical protein
MPWELGTPTDKSGPAYQRSRKRQFLKYVGAASIGFGGGTLLTKGDSTEGIVSAFGTNTTQTNGSTTESIEQPIDSEMELGVEDVASVEAVRGQESHLLATVTVSNPREEALRRGLFVTVRHEPYESTGDRIVQLPARSREEYLVRVPRAGQIRSAVLSAVENDDYEIEASLGSLPERYGDG